jgi:hypothetical protein
LGRLKVVKNHLSGGIWPRVCNTQVAASSIRAGSSSIGSASEIRSTGTMEE